MAATTGYDQIQSVEGSEGGTIVTVKALPRVQSELNFGLSFEHLDFNFNNEHLKDLKVRQAIATGLDVQQLTADRQRPGSSRRWPSGSPT